MSLICVCELIFEEYKSNTHKTKSKAFLDCCWLKDHSKVFNLQSVLLHKAFTVRSNQLRGMSLFNVSSRDRSEAEHKTPYALAVVWILICCLNVLIYIDVSVCKWALHLCQSQTPMAWTNESECSTALPPAGAQTHCRWQLRQRSQKLVLLRKQKRVLYLHIPVKLYMILTQRGNAGGSNPSSLTSRDTEPNNTRYFK